MNATPSSQRGCSCTSCVINKEKSGGDCQLNRNREMSALALDEIVVGCEERDTDMEGVCGPVVACMLLPASAGGLPARAEMVLAVPVVALLSDWANARDASARGATRLLAWEPETGIAEQVKPQAAL